MIRIIEISLTLLIAVAIPASGEEQCEVEKCPEIGSTEIEEELKLLAVPWDCGQYIICDRGVQYIRPCPPGLHFIPELGVCEFPDRAECIETCSISPTD